MINITLLIFIVMKVSQTQALVQLRTSLASSDNPLLAKILQSIDAATSDEHLFEVTLKLLKSLCVCMRDTLKAKEDTYNSAKNLIGLSKTVTTEGKVLDLYKKIYNNTCFNLKQDLFKRTNTSSESWNNSNCGKEDRQNESITQKNVKDLGTVKNVLRSKLDHILYRALVQTRHHHKYNIKKYNLFGKAKSKVKSSSKHTLIVILTLHPERKDLRKYNVVEEDLHKVLHKNSTIDIDIIDTRYDKKGKESEEAVKPTIYSDCHLQSLYTYLAESEKKNLTKVFRFLRRRDTIKIYIEVFTGRNHSDYINICCHNGTISALCKKELIENLNSQKDITVQYKKLDKKKSMALKNKFKNTISKLKKLVKKLDYKPFHNSTIDSNINNTDIFNTITSENGMKNAMLTIKENSSVTDQLGLKPNSLPPNLVGNLTHPLKLQDVSRAIILLNDFVSKQTTINFIKSPGTNQADYTQVDLMNTLALTEFPFIESNVIAHKELSPTSISNLKIFEENATISATETEARQDAINMMTVAKQNINDFNKNVTLQTNDVTKLPTLFFKTNAYVTTSAIQNEKVNNKSLAFNFASTDLDNEITTHNINTEIMPNTDVNKTNLILKNNLPHKLPSYKALKQFSLKNFSITSYDRVTNEFNSTKMGYTKQFSSKSGKNPDNHHVLQNENHILNKYQNQDKYKITDEHEKTTIMSKRGKTKLITHNIFKHISLLNSKRKNITLPMPFTFSIKTQPTKVNYSNFLHIQQELKPEALTTQLEDRISTEPNKHLEQSTKLINKVIQENVKAYPLELNNEAFQINIVPLQVKVTTYKNGNISTIDFDAKKTKKWSRIKKNGKTTASVWPNNKYNYDKLRPLNSAQPHSLHHKGKFKSKYKTNYSYPLSKHDEHKNHLTFTSDGFTTKSFQLFLQQNHVLKIKERSTFSERPSYLTEIPTTLDNKRKQIELPTKSLIGTEQKLPWKNYNTKLHTPMDSLITPHSVFVNTNESDIFENQISSYWPTVGDNRPFYKHLPTHSWLSMTTNKPYNAETFNAASIVTVNTYYRGKKVFKKLHGPFTGNANTGDKSIVEPNFRQGEVSSKFTRKGNDILENTINESYQAGDALLSDLKYKNDIQTEYISVTSIPNTVPFTKSSNILTKSVSSDKMTPKLNNITSTSFDYYSRIKTVSLKTETVIPKMEWNSQFVTIVPLYNITNTFNKSLFSFSKEKNDTAVLNMSNLIHNRDVDFKTLNTTSLTMKLNDNLLDNRNRKIMYKGLLPSQERSKNYERYNSFSINNSTLLLKTKFYDLRKTVNYADSSIFKSKNKTIFSKKANTADIDDDKMVSDKQKVQEMITTPTVELTKVTNTSIPNFYTINYRELDPIENTINYVETFKDQIEHTIPTDKDTTLDSRYNHYKTKKIESNTRATMLTRTATNHNYSTRLGNITEMGKNCIHDIENITNERAIINPNVLSRNGIKIFTNPIKYEPPNTKNMIDQEPFTFTGTTIFSTSSIPHKNAKSSANLVTVLTRFVYGSLENKYNFSDIKTIKNKNKIQGIVKNRSLLQNNITGTSDSTVKYTPLDTKATTSEEPYDFDEMENSIFDKTAKNLYNFEKNTSIVFNTTSDEKNEEVFLTKPLIAKSSENSGHDLDPTMNTEIHQKNFIETYENAEKNTGPKTKETMFEEPYESEIAENVVSQTRTQAISNINTTENIVSRSKVTVLTTKPIFLQRNIESASNRTLKYSLKNIKDTMFSVSYNTILELGNVNASSTMWNTPKNYESEVNNIGNTDDKNKTMNTSTNATETRTITNQEFETTKKYTLPIKKSFGQPYNFSGTENTIFHNTPDPIHNVMYGTNSHNTENIINAIKKKINRDKITDSNTNTIFPLINNKATSSSTLKYNSKNIIDTRFTKSYIGILEPRKVKASSTIWNTTKSYENNFNTSNIDHEVTDTSTNTTGSQNNTKQTFESITKNTTFKEPYNFLDTENTEFDNTTDPINNEMFASNSKNTKDMIDGIENIVTRSKITDSNTNRIFPLINNKATSSSTLKYNSKNIIDTRFTKSYIGILEPRNVKASSTIWNTTKSYENNFNTSNIDHEVTDTSTNTTGSQNNTKQTFESITKNTTFKEPYNFLDTENTEFDNTTDPINNEMFASNSKNTEDMIDGIENIVTRSKITDSNTNTIFPLINNKATSSSTLKYNSKNIIDTRFTKSYIGILEPRNVKASSTIWNTTKSYENNFNTSNIDHEVTDTSTNTTGSQNNTKQTFESITKNTTFKEPYNFLDTENTEFDNTTDPINNEMFASNSKNTKDMIDGIENIVTRSKITDSNTNTIFPLINNKANSRSTLKYNSKNIIDTRFTKSYIGILEPRNVKASSTIWNTTKNYENDLNTIETINNVSKIKDTSINKTEKLEGNNVQEFESINQYTLPFTQNTTFEKSYKFSGTETTVFYNAPDPINNEMYETNSNNTEDIINAIKNIVSRNKIADLITKPILLERNIKGTSNSTLKYTVKNIKDTMFTKLYNTVSKSKNVKVISGMWNTTKNYDNDVSNMETIDNIIKIKYSLTNTTGTQNSTGKLFESIIKYKLPITNNTTYKEPYNFLSITNMKFDNTLDPINNEVFPNNITSINEIPDIQTNLTVKNKYTTANLKNTGTHSPPYIKNTIFELYNYEENKNNMLNMNNVISKLNDQIPPPKLNITENDKRDINFVKIKKIQSMITNPIFLPKNPTKTFDSTAKYIRTNAKEALFKKPYDLVGTDNKTIEAINGKKQKNNERNVPNTNEAFLQNTIEMSDTVQYTPINIQDTTFTKLHNFEETENDTFNTTPEPNDKTALSKLNNTEIYDENSKDVKEINEIKDSKINLTTAQHKNKDIPRNILKYMLPNSDRTGSKTPCYIKQTKNVNLSPTYEGKKSIEADTKITNANTKKSVIVIKDIKNIMDVNEVDGTKYRHKNTPVILGSTIKYAQPFTKQTISKKPYNETENAIVNHNIKAASERQPATNLNIVSTHNETLTISKNRYSEEHFNFGETETISDSALLAINNKNITAKPNVTKIYSYYAVKFGNVSKAPNVTNSTFLQNIKTTAGSTTKYTLPVLNDSLRGNLYFKDIENTPPKTTHEFKNISTSKVKKTFTENFTTTAHERILNKIASEPYKRTNKTTKKSPATVHKTKSLTKSMSMKFVTSTPKISVHTTLKTKRKLKMKTTSTENKDSYLESIQPFNITKPILPLLTTSLTTDLLIINTAELNKIPQNNKIKTFVTQLSPTNVKKGNIKLKELQFPEGNTKKLMISKKTSKKLTKEKHLHVLSIPLAFNTDATLKPGDLYPILYSLSNSTTHVLKYNTTPKVGEVHKIHNKKISNVAIPYTARVTTQSYEEILRTQLSNRMTSKKNQNITDKTAVFNNYLYSQPVQKHNVFKKIISEYVTQPKLHNAKDKSLTIKKKSTRTAHITKMDTTKTFAEPTKIPRAVYQNGGLNPTIFSSTKQTMKPDTFELSIRVGIETNKDRIKFSLVGIDEKPTNMNHRIQSKLTTKASTKMLGLPLSVNQVKQTYLSAHLKNNILNNQVLTLKNLTRRVNDKTEIEETVTLLNDLKQIVLPETSTSREEMQVTVTKNPQTKTHSNIIANNISTIDDGNKTTVIYSTTVLEDKQITQIMKVSSTAYPILKQHKKIVIKPASLTDQLTIETLKEMYQEHLQKLKKNNTVTEKVNVTNENVTINSTLVTKNEEENDYSIDSLFRENDDSEDDNSMFVPHYVQKVKKEILNNVTEKHKISHSTTHTLNIHDDFMNNSQYRTGTNTPTFFQNEKNKTALAMVVKDINLKNNSKFTIEHLEKIRKNTDTIAYSTDIKMQLENETIYNAPNQNKITSKTNQSVTEITNISVGKPSPDQTKKENYNKKNKSFTKKRKKLINALKYKHDVAKILKKLVKTKKLDIKKLNLTNKKNVIHSLLSKIRKPTIHINETYTQHKGTIISNNTNYRRLSIEKLSEKFKTQIDKPTRKSYSINYANDIETKHNDPILIPTDTIPLKENANGINLNRSFAMTSTLYLTELTIKPEQKSDPNSFWGIRLNEIGGLLKSTQSYKFLNQSLKNIPQIIPAATFDQIGIKDKITKLVTSKPIIYNYTATSIIPSNTTSVFSSIHNVVYKQIGFTKNNPNFDKDNKSNLKMTTFTTTKMKPQNEKHYITIKISIPYLTLLATTKKTSDELDKSPKNMNTKEYTQFIESERKTVLNQQSKHGLYTSTPTVFINNTTQTNSRVQPKVLRDTSSISNVLETLSNIQENLNDLLTSNDTKTRNDTYINQITASYDKEISTMSSLVINDSHLRQHVSVQNKPINESLKQVINERNSTIPKESFNNLIEETGNKFNQIYSAIPNANDFSMTLNTLLLDNLSDIKGVTSNTEHISKYENINKVTKNPQKYYLRSLSNQILPWDAPELTQIKRVLYTTNKIMPRRTTNNTNLFITNTDNYFIKTDAYIIPTIATKALNLDQVTFYQKNNPGSVEATTFKPAKRTTLSSAPFNKENSIKIPNTSYNYEITELNNITTEQSLHSIYKTSSIPNSYQNVYKKNTTHSQENTYYRKLTTTDKSKFGTSMGQLPLKSITNYISHIKYSKTNKNKLVISTSTIINNNNCSYDNKHKLEIGNTINKNLKNNNVTNTEKSKSTLNVTSGLNTRLFSFNQTRIIQNSVGMMSKKPSSVGKKELITNNASDFNDNFKINTYPESTANENVISSLEPIKLNNKNINHHLKLSNDSILEISTIAELYNKTSSNTLEGNWTYGLNYTTPIPHTTTLKEFEEDQLNNKKLYFSSSTLDGKNLTPSLITDNAKLFNINSNTGSVTTTVKEMKLGTTAKPYFNIALLSTYRNSSMYTTTRSPKIRKENYFQGTSKMLLQILPNAPSTIGLKLNHYTTTSIKNPYTTRHEKLSSFESSHVDASNLSQDLKDEIVTKDLLNANTINLTKTPNTSIIFKTKFSQNLNKNRADSMTTVMQLDTIFTQHAQTLIVPPLLKMKNSTKNYIAERKQQTTTNGIRSPLNSLLKHKNQDSELSSFDKIHLTTQVTSTNAKEESDNTSHLVVMPLNTISKNHIISQIYILDPLTSKTIWSRHTRGNTGHNANTTKIYQRSKGFTHTNLYSIKQQSKNSQDMTVTMASHISEVNMSGNKEFQDNKTKLTSIKTTNPFLLNTSIQQKQSLKKNKKHDSQNKIRQKVTNIPNLDRTRHYSQPNIPGLPKFVTVEKYKYNNTKSTSTDDQSNRFLPTTYKSSTDTNLISTRKIKYNPSSTIFFESGSIEGKNVNIYSSRLNRYHFLRPSLHRVTKHVKYNTYQPLIKEDYESPKYKPKLSPRPNVSCAILKTMRHKFHSTFEFIEFLKESNCTTDNLAIHFNIKNHRFAQSPPKQSLNRKMNNIKHPSIKLTKKVFTRLGSKESLLNSFEKTKLFPVKSAKAVLPKLPPSVMKRINIGGLRRKEIMSMNTHDFFSQHRLATPSHLKNQNVNLRQNNLLLVNTRHSVLRPKFNPLEMPRHKLDRPKTFFLPPRNEEETFANMYEVPPHHKKINWKQQIGTLRAALQNNPGNLLLPQIKMPVSNVLDKPITHIKTDWNFFKDKIDLSKRKLWGPSDFVQSTWPATYDISLPSTPTGDQYNPQQLQYRRNFQVVTHTPKGAPLKPVTDWWLNDMYLKVRLPLPINSNPGMVFPRRHFAKMEEVADLGALFIDDILDYKEMLDRGELPLERATSRDKGQPLCMEQFYRLLGVCRIPEVGKDRLELPSVKSGTEEQEELVVVACRNYFYPIPVKAVDRGRITPGEIQAQLLHAMVDAAGAPPAPRVGLLTSMNRDQWAKAREYLIKDEMNRMNMELISRALCILCLDEAGGDRADTDPETNAMLRAMHGAGTRHHSANRWFDKTVQLIISSDGTVGMCYEHSAAEGVAVVRLAERALARAEVADRPAPPPALLPAPQAMKWNIVPDVQRNIEQAARDLDRAISDLDFKVYTYRGYGREFMKSCRTSPDVYIQLAIQYAYYKMYGYLVTTYESASLRRFRQGRVDNIRSAHGAALAWAAAMCTADASPLNDMTDEGQKKVSFNLYGEQKKLELFEEAARKQTSIMEANILGKGIDNHLLGLREMARETLGELPPVFCDVAYKQMFEFKMSTSQVATTTDGTFMGYGAVCPDGYGCCYNPKKDSIIFCISSFTSSSVTNTEAYKQSLEEALDSMKLMFQARKVDN